MLAKGLDLPLVTLVGIVLADAGLNLPDPFAAERGFQLLTQVAGRAGRSERGGQVILQSFMPENEVIQAASRHDYSGFFTQEIANRKKLGYPPFSRLVRLEYQHKNLEKAEKSSMDMAAMLAKRMEKEKRTETDLIGPVPCFFAKQAGLYRWQVILRGPDPASLLHGRLPEGWRIEVEPVKFAIICLFWFRRNHANPVVYFAKTTANLLNPDDVDANRRGEITPAQNERLKRYDAWRAGVRNVYRTGIHFGDHNFSSFHELVGRQWFRLVRLATSGFSGCVVLLGFSKGIYNWWRNSLQA